MSFVSLTDGGSETRFSEQSRLTHASRRFHRFDDDLHIEPERIKKRMKRCLFAFAA